MITWLTQSCLKGLAAISGNEQKLRREKRQREDPHVISFNHPRTTSSKLGIHNFRSLPIRCQSHGLLTLGLRSTFCFPRLTSVARWIWRSTRIALVSPHVMSLDDFS